MPPKQPLATARLSWNSCYACGEKLGNNKEDPYMRYLMTGGAGFIGSNIVEELLQRGQHVRVLDNFLLDGERI